MWRENFLLDSKLIEVSADGIIFRDTSLKECLSKVEIKCPYPPAADMYKADVYYSLPTYYTLQILSEMAAEPISDNCLFVCYSPKSAVIMRVTNDKQLWNEILPHIDVIYSVEKGKLKAPKSKSDFIKNKLPKLLNDFASNNVELVCEVPSVKAAISISDHGRDITDNQPYTMPIEDVNLGFRGYKINDLQKFLQRIEESIKLAYQLSRVKANEVLVWMLSTTDRAWNPDRPYACPIAYGLKGGKFDINVKRNYFNFIMDAVVREGYHVTCSVFDGEWVNLILNDRNGNPLTLGALQRKLFTRIKSMKKSDQIKILSDINNIHKLQLSDHIFKENAKVVVKGLHQLPHRPLILATNVEREPEKQPQQQLKKRRKAAYQPSSLISLCKKMISSGKVKKASLNARLSELLWDQTLDSWKEKSCINHNMGSPYPATWFSVPEYDKKRQRIEPKLWDGTHLLSNLRRVVCEKGTDNLCKEAWLCVAQTNKTQLREPMVTDLVDKQAIEFAKTTFSKEVAAEMIKLGYREEAKFCILVSNWWEAEDEPGVSAKTRFEQRMALRDYLLEGVDFGRFPPYGTHIKG